MRKIIVKFRARIVNRFKTHPYFVIKPLWGRQRGLMRLSKSLFDNAKWALSFCQMSLMESWINIRSKVHIYASYEIAKFISWQPDKRRVSFFHIVNWFKNLLIRLFTVAWHGCKRVRDAAFFLIIMLVTFAATLLKPQKYVSSRTIQKCVEHVSTST